MALPPFRIEMRNSGIPADEYLQEAFPTHSSPGPRIVVRGDGESHTALRRGIQEFYSVFFSGYTSYLLLDLASLCGVTGRLQAGVLFAIGAGRQAGDPFEKFTEYRL